MFEKQLTKFRDALTAKAGLLYQETSKLQSASGQLSQADAVKLAQMTIRALVLLDISDIITSLL